MKKIILVLLVLTAARANAQIEWSNYATSFTTKDRLSLGVAIPYDGLHDNFYKSIAGIARWNEQSDVKIDAAIPDSVPLYFVYNTADVYFLFPSINKTNVDEFEYRVLLNNDRVIFPWVMISQYTQNDIGSMKAGSGISLGVSAALNEYVVLQVRQRKTLVIHSVVVYYTERRPIITEVLTSEDFKSFDAAISHKDFWRKDGDDIGWHRRYVAVPFKADNPLRLQHKERNLLIKTDGKIYNKQALEYALLVNGKTIRDWAENDYDGNQILLKNLSPGNYSLGIRFGQQQNSVNFFSFRIAVPWYRRVAFQASLLSLLAVVAGVAIYFFKYRSQKKQIAVLNNQLQQSVDELKSIHSLLNPHFTFNALSSIQSLVNKGDVKNANTYLSSFATLLRETLKESQAQQLPLYKELENLKTYISLEQLRFQFKISFSINEGIDVYAVTIPPFLLQPFVENAIKHALAEMNGQGELSINVFRNSDSMKISILDNGKGFDAVSSVEGYGFSLSKKRIALLNNSYGEELISLNVESTGEGTRVIVLFKNWL